ncbi:cytochrome P450 3A2-like [Tachypleus tridentatus]|uniref:cytochrome P450 3A2-like n=1 Tax=Tachypleus tridentatus TaxID=6853 RepID=UPI003FD57342
MESLSFVPNWVLGVVIFLTLCYLYLRKKCHYWLDRGLPAVTSPFELFNFRKKLHHLELEHYKKLGRIHGLLDGFNPAISVGEPELLKNILVKDFHAFSRVRDFSVNDAILDKMLFSLQDEDWKRVRTILTPTFTSKRMRGMAEQIGKCAEVITNAFLKAADEGKTVDCKKYFQSLTMDIIARCAFGIKISSLDDPNNQFVVNGKKFFSGSFKFVLFFLLPWVFRMFNINIVDTQAEQFFKDITMKLIEERRKSSQQESRYDDFLQLLLDAQNDETKDGEILEIGSEGKEKSNKLKELSEDEIISQCCMFFVVGSQTTSLTLSFVLYNLAVNPECQEKLVQEIKESLQNENQCLHDIVNKMNYFDAVISETLRLFPPAIFSERRCTEDYVLDYGNIVIPKDMIIHYPIYAIHHDPEWFPDPETFNPDRFLPENKDSILPYTYFPFGAGPRNCIGMRFAQLVVKICLLKILTAVKFSRCKETKVPIVISSDIGLLEPEDVILKLERRET